MFRRTLTLQQTRSMTWEICKAAFSELERFWNKPSSHSSSARNAWEGKWRRRVVLKLQGEKLLLFFWVGGTVKTISFLQALMRRNTAVKKPKNLVTNSTESWSAEAAPRRCQHVPWRQPALGPLTPRTGGHHVQGEPARGRRDTDAGTYTTCHCWEQKQFHSVEKNCKSLPISTNSRDFTLNNLPRRINVQTECLWTYSRLSKGVLCLSFQFSI